MAFALAGLPAILRGIANAPLNRDRRLRALGGFALWQLQSRLSARPRIIPWVDAARLSVTNGVRGLTGNLYAGLAEPEEMGFVLHALRPGDGFIDVGANAGAFTVLAAAVCGARVDAFEPVPQTFARLKAQVVLNGLGDRVAARQMGVAAALGVLSFTTGQDARNHVSDGTDGQPVLQVPVTTLDATIIRDRPLYLKIDTEGYEHAVLQGAADLLADAALRGVIVEVNGSGRAYGATNKMVLARLKAAGLQRCSYDPVTRDLTVGAVAGRHRNALFLRDPGAVQALCRAAPVRRIHTAGGFAL
jgi:FkbM family methyltransferase